MFQQTKSNINTFFTSYLESRATIKILVIPVGNISNKNFQNYFNRLCQFSCIPLQTITPPAKLVPPTNVNTSSSISSFGKLKKKRNSHNEGSSSVFNISYEYGAIYFQFINGKKILDRNEMSWLDVTQYEGMNHAGRHRYDDEHHNDEEDFHQQRWSFGGYDEARAHNLQAVSFSNLFAP